MRDEQIGKMPNLLPYNRSEFDDVTVARCIALMRLQWQVFLDPKMSLESFLALVQQEDTFLTSAINRKFDNLAPDIYVKALKSGGRVKIDAAVLKDYSNEEDAYHDLVKVLMGMDRHTVQETTRISTWDIPKYFAALCDMVAEFESYDDLAETTFQGLLDVESKRNDPLWVRKIVEEFRQRWRKRIQFISPQFAGTVSELSREYLAWLHSHPKAIESIAWATFERLVAEIFIAKGFTVEFTARSTGRSADIIALSVDELGITTKYLVECKCYSTDNKVGLNVVNAVLGAKQRAGADHALLVTTSSFTTDVTTDEARWQDLRLHLKDGTAVQQWLREIDPATITGTFVDPGFEK